MRIHLIISLGGDTDTQASIVGSIAQAFYKDIDLDLKVRAIMKLSWGLIIITDSFNSKLIKLELTGASYKIYNNHDLGLISYFLQHMLH